MISRTTVDFFNELHIRASNLFASIGENEIERNKEFSLFKKKFQVIFIILDNQIIFDNKLEIAHV